jgi:hypothetical protein
MDPKVAENKVLKLIIVNSTTQPRIVDVYLRLGLPIFPYPAPPRVKGTLAVRANRVQ